MAEIGAVDTIRKLNRDRWLSMMWQRNSPARDIVALRIATMSGVKAGVYLFSTESVALYKELTGKSVQFAFNWQTQERGGRQPDGRVECQSVQATTSRVPGVSCGACGRQFSSVREFGEHQVPGWDGRLICPESSARYPLLPRR